MTQATCENHDDGETVAMIKCNMCGNLCAECDRFLHLSRKTRQHHRQIFKEAEESVRVDLHEGCGRLKLFWFLALADSRTLKAVVEFKSLDGSSSSSVFDSSASASNGSTSCRFCRAKCDSLQLTCHDPTCQQLYSVACKKTLSCGHLCGGVEGEAECLPCLRCDKSLKQDADDMCMICFTDSLSAAPAIKMDCGHIFHYLCYETLLKKRWSGPRITFGFMNCSICKVEASHPSLEKFLTPLRELKQQVENKSLQRLQYEGLADCDVIKRDEGGKFYGKPLEFALAKYAYYLCHKCNKAYYGGEVRCEMDLNEDSFDANELTCGACSDVTCAQICHKHGTDYLEYKCRYCCSVAVYFCFGTTHFCRVCHDDFQRILAIPRDQLPKCPAPPGAHHRHGDHSSNNGGGDDARCPLNIKHPPTGNEFALGCGVCRNRSTF